MIQDIAPRVFDPVYREKKPEPDDYVLHYSFNKVMLLRQGETCRIPTFRDLEGEGDWAAEAYYLFSIDGRAYYLNSERETPEFGDWVMEGLQIFRDFSPMYQAFAGITGSQIYRWRQSRKFCGFCGRRTEISHTERALVCPACGHMEYPKISPAIIVAVIDRERNKLLMSRYAHGSYRRYALIAGFVEVGETFEACVRREVMEEVGLRVKNIRYYKSQPWAFSDTEMVGFVADLDGDPYIRLQEEELSEAGWFSKDEIQEYPPYISVGHEMMRAFKEGRFDR